MRILLVDDDLSSREAVQFSLTTLGHEVTVCASGEQALHALAETDFPMLLTDIRMPGMSGIDLLKAVKASPTAWRTDVVLFTGNADVDSAVAALRGGAYDYLFKPMDARQLAAVVNRIAEHQMLLRENKQYREKFNDIVTEATQQTRQELEEMRKKVSESSIGKIGIFSSAMQSVLSLAEKFHFDRNIPVLIQGETGAGKEIVARTVHFGDGHHVTGPFIDINCAAIAPTLFESELFGYEAGAFTGATSRGQKGKLDAAQGGTLFLDEIGDLPLELQGKFLRVLQEKEYYRIGGLKSIKANVRIVCATNSPLEKRVDDGTFRKDLYYRLKVGHLVISPLRERRKEIVSLALMFLADFSQQKRKNFTSISPAASQLLQSYNWPGNVRELRNTIEFAVFMYDDHELKSEYIACRLTNTHTPILETNNHIIDHLSLPLPNDGYPLKKYTNDIIKAVLCKTGGNQLATAKYLAISPRMIGYRLETLKAQTDPTKC